MYPQKADKVIREFAQLQGVDPDDMVYIMINVYQHLKDTMATYDHNKIYMDGLGTFFFRVWKIEQEVKKCNHILRQGKLPIHVLEEIQEKRQNLIKMDAIILEEMTRRSEKRLAINMGVHNAGKNMYNVGCRCESCTVAHAKEQRAYYKMKRDQKSREQYRQQKIQEHESKK